MFFPIRTRIIWVLGLYNEVVKKGGGLHRSVKWWLNYHPFHGPPSYTQPHQNYSHQKQRLITWLVAIIFFTSNKGVVGRACPPVGKFRKNLWRQSHNPQSIINSVSSAETNPKSTIPPGCQEKIKTAITTSGTLFSLKLVPASKLAIFLTRVLDFEGVTNIFSNLTLLLEPFIWSPAILRLHPGKTVMTGWKIPTMKIRISYRNEWFSKDRLFESFFKQFFDHGFPGFWWTAGPL